MNILLVTPFLPYPGVPHAGGKLVFHLLSTLAERHSVFLVSRIFPGEEANLSILRGIVTGIETVPAEGPVRMESLASRLRTVHSYYRLAVRARETLSRGSFDLMQVEFAETAVFLRPPEGFPAALTLHDVKAKPAARRYEASRGAARGIRWGSWKVTRVLEQRAAIPFGVVFTLSEVDREWAERLYRGLRFRVLRYPAGLEFRGAHRAEVTGRILFVGALNRPENTEAVRYFLGHVWPTVRERFTDSEFWVAGGGLGETLRKELLSDSRVRVTGHVENLEEIYATASVFVAPVLAGGGVIVKILDALAAGIPVVTTPYGNEGIGAKEGDEILVAGGPDRFLEHVLSLQGDPDRRKAIGEAGRHFVQARFSREGFRQSLEEAYATLRREA